MAIDNPETVTSDWRPVFGHDAPYPEQEDGVETAIDTAMDGGYLALEGACGTGKTMLALTAGIHLVRDPDTRFERVLVLTSVKQQLRQFETDLRTVNDELPDDWDPVSAVTLVGKADVCPYNREGAGGIDDANVYDRCERLRERTRDLADDSGAGALVERARGQQTGLASSAAGDGASYLETAGEPSPYAPEMPEYGTDADEVEFCPFYAQYLDDLPEEDDDGSAAEAIPFDVTQAGLLDPEELVARSAAAGTCPHSVMGEVLTVAEVVVGNYYHAFDPLTVQTFSGPLLDESTFVVCDEAHMLEPRVRALVSDGVADETLHRAESELTRTLQPLEFDEREGGQAAHQTEQAAEVVREELEKSDASLDELTALRALVRDLREELDERVTAFLDREHPGWTSALADLPDEEIPLRDPEEPATDEITEWAERVGHHEGVWARAETVGAVVERALDRLEDGDEADDPDRAAPTVGRVLGAWSREGHVDYFREIELERTWNELEAEGTWRRAYTARLALHNCVPSETIGAQLGEFGGGVLMSATLEPMDVFREVTGLDHLAADGRPVVERRYGLSFPEENRESLAVAAPKYTYDNRGAPGEETPTRQTYASLVAEVASRDGNVLVGMPNYVEAEWMADTLRERLAKPVLLDESSADAVTEDLKGEFFAGDGKVLVTSLRGTLTEGVDYRGDRLSAAVVCGVPIINTASPRTRAVRTAYDRVFGDGFRYALTVPAVRKARQAVGRVIRGPEERGVRVLLDERYARDSWDSVRDLLPPGEREEFQPVSPDMLAFGLDRFWG
jgi:DNA excision repair protein ERCC-2